MAWQSFENCVLNQKITPEIEGQFLNFVSDHIHTIGTDNEIKGCDWCYEGSFVIDLVLDDKETFLFSWSEDTQVSLVHLLCEKYQGTSDDHIYLANLASELIRLPFCSRGVKEDWLENFATNSEWVQSDGIDLIERFPSDVLEFAISPSVEPEFLAASVNAYHGHLFRVCEDLPLEKCNSCVELIKAAISLNLRNTDIDWQ